MRSPLLLLLPLASSVLAGVHEVWWNVTYVQDVNPDGLFPRQVIGVNNTWPYGSPAFLKKKKKIDINHIFTAHLHSTSTQPTL